MGVLDLRKVSISSELKSFLLGMCIEAPESTTNYLSSGVFEDGAGNDQTSAMLLCGRIVLVARFPEMTHPHILAHTDCVLEGHTFE